jgi:hypothetical protein
MQKFDAALGATYALEFSTDNTTWDVIEDDIVGENETIYRSWRISLFDVM